MWAYNSQQSRRQRLDLGMRFSKETSPCKSSSDIPLESSYNSPQLTWAGALCRKKVWAFEERLIAVVRLPLSTPFLKPFLMLYLLQTMFLSSYALVPIFQLPLVYLYKILFWFSKNFLWNACIFIMLASLFCLGLHLMPLILSFCLLGLGFHLLKSFFHRERVEVEGWLKSWSSVTCR